MKKLTLAFILALTVLVSCKKDADKKPDDTSGSSRTIRYEVTGNFTGSLIASYTTAAGGTTNDQIAALPWNIRNSICQKRNCGYYCGIRRWRCSRADS